MENSAKRRRKEVKWGTSASSNAQFLLRSVCVGNREDGRFLVKIINNMCSVIVFSRLFAIFISREWKKKTKSQQNVPPSLLSLSPDMVNFLRTPIFLVALKS